MSSTYKKIFIVYHVSVMGAWEGILEEQLNLLQTTGLGTAAEKIYVQLCGIKNKLEFLSVKKKFEHFSYYSKISFKFLNSVEVYEFPSIRQVQSIAKLYPSSKIFYFHTKGASHPLRYHNPVEIKNLNQWRKMMEYFNITKWKTCQQTLDYVDACGVEWGQVEYGSPFIFAGNFWWANANYINKCKLTLGDRLNCERFISSGNPKIKNFYSSGDNEKLRKYSSEEEIRKHLAPPHAFYNLKLFNYHGAYLEEKYFQD